MGHFYNTFIYAFTSLFSMLNPIGMSVVFLEMTKNYPVHKRYRMAYQVAFYSAILLIGTFFFGPSVLIFFGVSLPCIQIAGGVVIFYTAWNMLYSNIKISHEAEQSLLEQHHDIIFFPLMMPITAGPGSIAITIALSTALSTRFMETNAFDHIAYISTISAIIAACFVVALFYRFADSIFNKLKLTGTNVVTKLMAFILLAISVSMLWKGLIGFIAEFYST